VSRRKLLFVSSNHPAISLGGLELYVLDLYEAFRNSQEFEPIFLSRAGAPFSETTRYHAGSPFALVNEDPNQYLFYTDIIADYASYDVLFGKSPVKQVLTRFFRDFLLAQQPDVVHFQHTLFLGYDIVRVTRNTLPDVPIVYSLHEYLPICHRDGQMVRVKNNELCTGSSPRRCNECFPEISPQTFYNRQRFIQSHLSLADQLIAPSEYVRDRYVDWGIPAAKVHVEPQGFSPNGTAVDEAGGDRPRNRFAYFGQLTPYKGSDVLLEAMEALGEDFDGHLWIFGANLDRQLPEFKERFERLLSEKENVTFVGQYDRADLGRLMQSIDWVVVPSIWWETGPLTVLEAFQYGRPVICSDIGGMSEKVTDGVNGLHFRRADAEHLAEVMLQAAETPGLWEKLRAGIPPRPPRTMDEHVEALSAIYSRLIAERSQQPLSQEAKMMLEGVGNA
jgi:glycosyltransferase involved in cell wall biosynthesis